MATIKEFLLSRVMQDEAESDARKPRPWAGEGEWSPSRSRSRASINTQLRADIEKHNNRSMTVTSRRGSEIITRCGNCPKGDLQPCRGLRLLALPYADHPAYQDEWRVT